MNDTIQGYRSVLKFQWEGEDARMLDIYIIMYRPYVQLGVRPLNYIVTSMRCYGCHFEWNKLDKCHVRTMYFDEFG